MLKKFKSILSHKTTKGLLALAILLGGSFATYSAVNADTVAGVTRQSPFTSVVTAIATKFGLSVTEVQAVVDEQMAKQHAEMEAKMQQDFATRLEEAVTSGKLTQAQADLITAKQAEIKTQMETLRTSETPPTKGQMKAFLEGLQTWATANNIPKEFLMFGFKGEGRGGGNHMGGGPGHFNLRVDKPATTQTQ